MKQTRGVWRTRFGFYLAAVGSALGLGNLWRFPYVVGDNGGGAFVLLYLTLALIVGTPLLIGELLIGHRTGKSILAATRDINAVHGRRAVRWMGRAAFVVGLIVLAYYAVISGWVLHFLTQFLVALMHPESLMEKTSLSTLLHNGWLQILLASAHLLVCVVVVSRGVQEGLEKWIGLTLPLFIVMTCFLLSQSLSLPAAGQALRFLFYPDFSRLTLSSLSSAIGHVLFSLSVGFGVMVTFGSYLHPKDHVPTAGFRVAVVDTILSFVAGLLVFPMALQASGTPLNEPVLLFETLPRFLASMPGGVYIGLIFFLCLYFAALGASIGMLEMVVSNGVDLLKVTRNTSAWGAGFLALIFGILPALSSSVLMNVRVLGYGLLEFLDSLLINWGLPLVGLGTCFFLDRYFHQEEFEKEFFHRESITSSILFPFWQKAIRWVIPSLILLGFILRLCHAIVSK